MRPAGHLIFICCFFIFSAPAFASSREEVIDNTLTQTERNYSSQNIAYQDAPYKTIMIGPSETSPPLNVSGSSERKKAIDKALNAYYIAAGYTYNHIHYSEWDNREKLDEDFGGQNGFYLNLGYKSSRYSDSELFRGKPFVEGYYRRDAATIRYKGAAFDLFGNTRPFNTMQRSDITRFGIKLGTRTDLGKEGEAFAYVDAGRRIWNRGENGIVDGVTVYKEKYEWFYYGLGLGLNYKIFPKWSLGIDWTGWFTGSPRMRAYLDEGGTFRLKDVKGTEIKIPLKYYALNNFSFDITPSYTYWRINHSDVVSISGIPLLEPDSNTNELAVLAGVTCYF